mgnify:CR=1 FL=1
MFGFLSDFLFGLVGVSTGALNTKKIDSNIELLKQQEWFKKIYTDEKYHRLFITNRGIANISEILYVKRNSTQKKPNTCTLRNLANGLDFI